MEGREGGLLTFLLEKGGGGLFYIRGGLNRGFTVIKKIRLCNQMVTSEIRELFHARFVHIPIMSRAFRRGKLYVLGFGQNAREIILLFLAAYHLITYLVIS